MSTDDAAGMVGQAADAQAGEEMGPSGVPRRVTVAAVLGTVLEWYDFAIYAALATVIARLFFPAADPTVALLVALASYAVGFVCRPVGAVVFGRMGDRVGRRTTLAVTILVVGSASLLIGLLPTYPSAGLLSPLLLVILRMAQGFAVGAEWTGGATYLIEHAATGRRGRYSGIVQAATVVGFLLGVGVVTLLTSTLGEAAVAHGVWRVPFLLGGAVAIVGLFVRLGLADSPEFRRARGAALTVDTGPAESMRRNWLLVFGSVFGLAVLGYTATGFPSYVAGVTGLPLTSALATNAAALVVEVPLIMVAGALSDRVGRTRVMTVAMVGFVVTVYPVFLLVGSGSVPLVLLGQVLFVVLYAGASGPMAALFMELFPTRLRSTGFGTSYNIGVALFGGTAPLVNTALASWTGSTMAPAHYLVFGALVALACLWRMPRGHDRELPR
ncbi:MFS transporter [Sciscionella marina]|uniref:MFS transporter n=1 Tax=Sciscionella marina TaxID=508770 RepID=UPI00035C134B|nr:MFS transporter [Sciscionella marina]